MRRANTLLWQAKNAERQDTVAGKQSDKQIDWNGAEKSVHFKMFSTTTICSSMGENVVRVSVGNRVRKTLSFTYFLEQPRDGVKFWTVSGNKRNAHISPSLSVEKCDRLMPRTSTIGRFIRFLQMKSSFPFIIRVWFATMEQVREVRDYIGISAG